jgi:hypothetical protein
MVLDIGRQRNTARIETACDDRSQSLSVGRVKKRGPVVETADRLSQFAWRTDTEAGANASRQ